MLVFRICFHPRCKDKFEPDVFEFKNFQSLISEVDTIRSIIILAKKGFLLTMFISALINSDVNNFIHIREQNIPHIHECQPKIPSHVQSKGLSLEASHTASLRRSAHVQRKRLTPKCCLSTQNKRHRKQRGAEDRIIKSIASKG